MNSRTEPEPYRTNALFVLEDRGRQKELPRTRSVGLGSYLHHVLTTLRREGPEGPGVQGMPEKFDFHVFLKCVFDIFTKRMRIGLNRIGLLGHMDLNWIDI